MFEYIETVMTSPHFGINDNLEDNKKAVVERCKKLTIYITLEIFYPSHSSTSPKYLQNQETP
jgi:hypothetical protein